MIRLLAEKSDAELREILAEVCRSRRPNPEEDEYNRNCFFLGTASSLLENEPDKAERWGPCRLHAVAYVDHDEYPDDHPGPDWGFCQFGTCGGCGTDVRSNYKRGVCPICGTEVTMT